MEQLQDCIGGTGEIACLLHVDLRMGNFLVDKQEVLVDQSSRLL